jgi:MSHA pilin protein MshA
VVLNAVLYADPNAALDLIRNKEIAVGYINLKRKVHMRSTRARSPASGFTLIELVVVIAVLGILAATALPRFTDMTVQARIAKMRAAQASLQTGASLFHAKWLAAGAPAGTTTVSMEGVMVPYMNGYPDVGGDGPAAEGAIATTASGIVIAAGGLADYSIITSTPQQLLVALDSDRTTCAVIYSQPIAAGLAPVIDDSGINTTNGPLNCR